MESSISKVVTALSTTQLDLGTRLQVAYEPVTYNHTAARVVSRPRLQPPGPIDPGVSTPQPVRLVQAPFHRGGRSGQSQDYRQHNSRGSHYSRGRGGAQAPHGQPRGSFHPGPQSAYVSSYRPRIQVSGATSAPRHTGTPVVNTLPAEAPTVVQEFTTSTEETRATAITGGASETAQPTPSVPSANLGMETVIE